MVAANNPLRQWTLIAATTRALDTKTKELIAVALAHVTQCPYCIRGHTGKALREGASEQEIMEAVWVAAEMRAGASFAHSRLAWTRMETAQSASG